MRLKHTPASRKGESRIWSCRRCGSTICITHAEKPAGRCPGCDEPAAWHEVHPPISVFDTEEGTDAIEDRY